MYTPCLNPASLPWGVELDAFLAAAHVAGFTSVEVSIQQMQRLIEQLSAEGVRELLASYSIQVEQASGLLPAGPVLPAPLLVPRREFEQSLETLPQRLAAFDTASCKRASIVVDPYVTARDYPEARNVAVDRLDLLAAKCAEHGIALCAEFIGVTDGLGTGEGRDVSFVRSLPELDRLLVDVAAENVGILFDTFHWNASGGNAMDIERCSRPIMFMQISDAPSSIERTLLSDSDRLMPGAGSLPWSDLGLEVSGSNYSGPVSVELFNPEIWSWPVAQICSTAMSSANHVGGLMRKSLA